MLLATAAGPEHRSNALFQTMFKPARSPADVARKRTDSTSSDFPSLSGGGPQSTANSTHSSWNSSALRQQQQQQPRTGQQSQQHLQQQQQRVPSAAPSQHSGEQSTQSPAEQGGGGGDEFPPLGGHGGQHLNGDAFASANGLRSPENAQPQSNGQLLQSSLPYRDSHPRSALQPQQQPPGGNHQLPASQTPSSSQTPIPTLAAQRAPSVSVKRYADMTEKERFGLEGLAAAYEARKAIESGQSVDETLPAIMRSGTFFGQDLNALGMDLDSPEPIWPTFTAFPASISQAQGAGPGAGGFDFHERAIVPEFTLPHAYTVTNVPPLSGRLGSLSDGMSPNFLFPRPLLDERDR